MNRTGIHMNKSVIIILCLCIPYLPLRAQVSEQALPGSLLLDKLKQTLSLPEYKLRQIDRFSLLEEDRLHPAPFRYALFEDVDIDLRKSGRTDYLPAQRSSIWRLGIGSDSARSIQLIFRKFNIPPGARLFIYDEGLAQVLGAFTSHNSRRDSTLTVADIVANRAVVEYNEPDDAEFRGEIIIGSVAQGYRDAYPMAGGESYVNVNCPEGKDIQLPKHAVCKITFRSGSGSYLCTGSLINNVRQDAKPYFLTASHCISDSAEASTMVAYFNFENEGCSGKTINGMTISGASLLSTSEGSDYSLLLLEDQPPSVYQPYFAGWDASGESAPHVTGIHHPEGLTKKLSIDHDTIDTNTIPIQWEGSPSSPVASHWEVGYDVGMTAGGSSGSPLFNKAGQIIGQLHGGDDAHDLYGKLSYSWTRASGSYSSLREILDPDNTGKTKIGGYYPPDNPPDAFIAIPVSKVCTHASIVLTDHSAFMPYSRTWTITPSTFSFVDGTSQSSPNPVVQFHQQGSYTVRLRIVNAAGIDSMKLSDAIQAGNTIEVGIASSPFGESCLCDFSHLAAWATGATEYNWAVEPGSQDRIILNSETGDSVVIMPGPAFRNDTASTFSVLVTGTQGVCTDTALMTHELLKPVNDDVRHATVLQYGTSDTFSNECATTEEGEPIPPHYSCTTQNSWCDEYGTGTNIVEKSVWFRFVAGSLGYINISSSGFDNEMALYSVNSPSDILAGNYEILGANDDRSNTDFNPIIRSAAVTPGKTYWLQVDGSGGGSIGNFYLQLTGLSITAVPGEREGLLSVYPQPSRGLVYISGDVLSGKRVHVYMYSVSGVLIQDEIYVTEGNQIAIDLTHLENGVYIARVDTGEEYLTTRIVKY